MADMYTLLEIKKFQISEDQGGEFYIPNERTSWSAVSHKSSMISYNEKIKELKENGGHSLIIRFNMTKQKITHITEVLNGEVVTKSVPAKTVARW